MKRNISNSTLRRMTYYLAYLKALPTDSHKFISAPIIAEALHLGEVQVRKDLAQIARPGQNKIGRNRQELISDIESRIGLAEPLNAVLIGTDDFLPWFLSQCGDNLCITSRFSVQKAAMRKGIQPLSALPEYCRDHQVQIGIVNVSSDMLYDVVEQLVSAGIHAIWNFSSVPIEDRDGVTILNENLMPSLGVLAFHAASTEHSPESK